MDTNGRMPSAPVRPETGTTLARAKADLLAMAHDEGEELRTRRAATIAVRQIGIVERAIDKASLFTLRNRLVQLKGQAEARQAAAPQVAK